MNVKKIASFLLTGLVVACSSSTDKPATESGESNELRKGDSCGGFIGLLCPEGLECVDDPSDACDPANGGADCMGTCQEAKYDPCGGKSCGDSCKVCPPGKADCFETAVMKACNAQGKCDTDLEPVCSGGDDDYDPCSGRSCGDGCKACPPGKADCFETAALKVCNAQGKCDTDLEPVCSGGAKDGGSDNDPCSGKSCGDSCTTCPAGQTCPAVVEACNAKGECTTDTPTCK